jgi:hypothetical protein
MKYAIANARQNRTGLVRATLAALALLTITFATGQPAGAAGNNPAPPPDVARINALMDSPDHPLPLLPVVVPEITTRAQVDEIVGQTREPYIFMLYQVKGPQSANQVPELFFFQLLAIEYMGNSGVVPRPIPPVHFRTIAADVTPEASNELYPTDAVKPVYILFDPSKSGSARFRVIDEAKVTDGSTFTQRVAEGWIMKYLAIQPAVLTPYQITVANHHDAIFVDANPNPAPTAKWIVTVYSPADPKWQASVNRLRVLLSVERYFYDGRIRFGEVNLASDAGVFNTLIGDANHLPVPTEPQVWLTDPVSHISVQYKPDFRADSQGPPTAELTQAAFQAWLLENHVTPPGNVALNAEQVSQQLWTAKGQQQAMLTPIRFTVGK